MALLRHPVIIVGGGLAGLASACRLKALDIPVQIFEASGRVGGRIKTDHKDGYLMDRGFQVLQTAYPEAKRILDYQRLNLRPFAPGVMVFFRGRFHTLADPLRRPDKFLGTLTAPIGTMADRLRLIRLARRASGGDLADLFRSRESTALQYLLDEGFSDNIIQRFFRPFFGGVCLDSHMSASNRVFNYVMRMFASGEAAIPEQGMEAIPRQMVGNLPEESILTGRRVRHIPGDGVTLDDGSFMPGKAVVVATEAPAAQKLLGFTPTGSSLAETCLYFTCDPEHWHSSFLMLNGDGRGPINNIAFLSQVSTAYAPAGKSLVSVVVLGDSRGDKMTLAERVRSQLVEWFGRQALSWEFLHGYEIAHALPDQSPPTPNPACPNPQVRPGVFVCGEHGSLPGIQWALVSGRKAADAAAALLRGGGSC